MSHFHLYKFEPTNNLDTTRCYIFVIIIFQWYLETKYPIKKISSNVVIRFIIYNAAVIRMIIIKKISPSAFLVHGSYGPFLRMNRSGFSKQGNACAVYIYNNNCRRRISYGNRMTGFFTSIF